MAARALGAGDRRLIGRHILPNTLPPLIVQGDGVGDLLDPKTARREAGSIRSA